MALRRTLIFFVYIIGGCFGIKKNISIPITICILLITSGAFIAGLEHLETDNLEGYTLVILSNIFSSISLILAKKYNDRDKINPLGL